MLCMAMLMLMTTSLLLVVAEGVVDVGEADGLVPGLDSCVEEEHQALATESYLRRGLVEQRDLVPAASAKKMTWTA